MSQDHEKAPEMECKVQLLPESVLGVAKVEDVIMDENSVLMSVDSYKSLVRLQKRQAEIQILCEEFCEGGSIEYFAKRLYEMRVYTNNPILSAFQEAIESVAEWSKQNKDFTPTLKGGQQ